MPPDEDHLPLFRSPLLESQQQTAYRGPTPDISEEEEPKGDVATEESENALLDSPQFHRHNEATNSELFYDLFFVANLTAFLAVHEVNDSDTLKQAAGFFCVLWFTWYQVSLYDVRFSTDSVYTRVTKVVQFMVMIGLAIVGPKFEAGQNANVSTQSSTGKNELPLDYFKALTIILMVSRINLVFQYLQSMWFTRQHNRILVPMGCIAATYFVASMIYLGLYWTFKLDAKGENHTYLTWYVVAVVETIIATTISCVWRNVSFKGTHLVQRMSLLTLIILGEGIIALAKRCQTIVQSDGGLNILVPSTIANIICGVLILYFIYMIYFDWMEEKQHFGTIRQQIWSFLHFPLHLALVLAVEGLSQCIAWRAAIQRSNDYDNTAATWSAALVPTISTPALRTLAEEVYNSTEFFIKSSLQTGPYIYETLEYVGNLGDALTATEVMVNGTQNAEAFHQAENAYQWMYQITRRSVFNIAGFAPPVNQSEVQGYLVTPLDWSDEHTVEEAVEALEKIGTTFELTYVYFFISIGLVVMICCVMATMSNRKKSQYHMGRISLSGLIGLGLCLLAIMDVNPSLLESFTSSPWMVPLVTICLFIVVVLNNAKPMVPKLANKGLRRRLTQRLTDRH